MAFIDIDGLYYEGDLANLHDIEVPTRPTPYHTYNKKLKQWVVDNDKVMVLKKQVLQKLDEELRVKTLLLNLTNEEKDAINKHYNDKVQQLSKVNDPVILQEITLN